MTFEPQGIYKNGFTYDHGKVSLLVIKGPDAPDFLNRLSTVKFDKTEESIHGAFLNGQGKLISLFTAWFEGDGIVFFIEKSMLSETAAYLEKMHFAEDLSFSQRDFYCVETRGEQNLEGPIKVRAFNWGLPGSYFFYEEKVQCLSISEYEFDAVRAYYGMPKPHQDISQNHILIEAPLEALVDRDKGCYPGQEVIERIYTYGRVARKIKKISFHPEARGILKQLAEELPFDLVVNDNNVGTLTSLYAEEQPFGLATLKRLFYEKNDSFEIEFKGQKIRGDCVSH